MLSEGEWRVYLAVKGVLLKLGKLISAEIENLTLLEETTLSSDLAQGFALKALTGMLGPNEGIVMIMDVQAARDELVYYAPQLFLSLPSVLYISDNDMDVKGTYLFPPPSLPPQTCCVRSWSTVS